MTITDAVARPARSLAAPAGTQPWRVSWYDTIGIVGIHLLALLAFVPWLFTWTGVVVAFIGLYVFGTLGINLCFHRLLTHRGFAVPKPLEHALAVFGVCSLQDTPARWVATHRSHHQHSDTQPDPHSPLVNFFWGHMGWMMVRNRELNRLGLCNRYAKDVLRDPFYSRFERKSYWASVVLASWAAFFLGGFAAELVLGGSLMEALQLGLSVLVWGVFVRTIVVWHITWSVNSVTHLWGYRNYETDDTSRNNVLIGLITNGEGWHNNHHADRRSARHGHRWWEIDVTWWIIRLLMALGLAQQVAMPAPTLSRRRFAAASADIPADGESP